LKERIYLRSKELSSYDPMEKKNQSQVIIDEICDYCEEKRIKYLLQQYLRRVIKSKPSNPVEFLIDTIE
jgi:hypothetical protein